LPTTPLEPEHLDAVEAALDVVFSDRSLLALALTHQSFVNEHPNVPPVSNERLEFLGDSIVGMIVADRLFTGAPDLAEGDLTVRRSQVVRRETLALAARAIGLGDWLVMGKGEAAAGGADRASNLSDTFEAVVGAVYVDRGYRQARSFVLRWLGEHVDEALRTETKKDPKSLLQEYLQGNGSKPPRYQLVSETGIPSDLVFEMEVVIDSKSIASGSGSRKIDAEREAARKALAILTTQPRSD
jgi:ribonuclease III